MANDPNSVNAGGVANPVSGLQPETVTTFMEGFFSDMQTNEMEKLGINWAALESPNFQDTMAQVELGFPGGLNLYPALAPPSKSNVKDEPVELEAYVIQKIVSQLPQPYQDQVTAAIKGGKPASPMVQELVTGVKAYALMYQTVTQASNVSPPSFPTWVQGQTAAVTSVVTVTQAMTISAGKIVAHTDAPTGNSLLSFLAQMSKDLLGYQSTMMKIEASNAETSQEFSTAQQQNTFAELSAQQWVIWNDNVYMQQQLQKQQQMLGVLGEV